MALANTITVEEEMRKNPELKESDLEILREWHKKQPHLPPISDFELIFFLHSNYYRTEPTKMTIDAFYTFKTHVPEFFSNRDPVGSKELREIMKVVCSLRVSSTTPEGYKVILAKLFDYEPSHYVFVDALKLIIMAIELSSYTAGTCPGYIIITDMEGTAFGHLARVGPMAVKKLVYFVQEAIPIRLKGFYFINTPPFMDLFLNMAKPFMKKELMDLIFLHNKIDTLDTKVPIDILPNELGGKAGPLKDLWATQVEEIENHREFFLEQDAYKVNEAVRPGKAKNATDIFGVEGSFKKLDID